MLILTNWEKEKEKIKKQELRKEIAKEVKDLIENKKNFTMEEYFAIVSKGNLKDGK